MKIDGMVGHLASNEMVVRPVCGPVMKQKQQQQQRDANMGARWGWQFSTKRTMSHSECNQQVSVTWSLCESNGVNARGTSGPFMANQTTKRRTSGRIHNFAKTARDKGGDGDPTRNAIV
jgi:hypothetical protein